MLSSAAILNAHTFKRSDFACPIRRPSKTTTNEIDSPHGMLFSKMESVIGFQSKIRVDNNDLLIKNLNYKILCQNAAIGKTGLLLDLSSHQP